MAKKTVYIPDDLLEAVGVAGGANLSREFQQFLRRRLVHGYSEPPPPIPVRDLVPYVHVADVAVSAHFYSLLGFEQVATVGARDAHQWWAYLQSDRARLMLAQASEPIDPDAQAVLLYLYADDLARLRTQLLAAGLEPSAIAHPAHMPGGEIRMVDPDGYVLLIGQLRRKP